MAVPTEPMMHWVVFNYRNSETSFPVQYHFQHQCQTSFGPSSPKFSETLNSHSSKQLPKVYEKCIISLQNVSSKLQLNSDMAVASRACNTEYLLLLWVTLHYINLYNEIFFISFVALKILQLFLLLKSCLEVAEDHAQ